MIRLDKLNDTELDELIDKTENLFEEYFKDTFFLMMYYKDALEERELRRRNHSGM